MRRRDIAAILKVSGLSLVWRAQPAVGFWMESRYPTVSAPSSPALASSVSMCMSRRKLGVNAHGDVAEDQRSWTLTRMRTMLWSRRANSIVSCGDMCMWRIAHITP